MAEPSSKSTGVTTINNLPEHLLLHILSFLPTLDAIRTSSLSRTWRNLWPSISSLDFDYTLFPPSGSFPVTRQLFADFVNQTLILRSDSRLHKFRLRFFFPEPRYYNLVVSWIRYAINHNVGELDINVEVDSGYREIEADCYYDFPLSALRINSVRVLRLHSCHLTIPQDRSMCFVSVRSLSLAEVFLPDRLVSLLISGFSNLESLVLNDCYGMENLKIYSLKLKELSLWYFDFEEDEVSSVEINAPSLRSLSIIRFEMGKYSLKDCSSLVEANVDFPYEDYKYWSKVVRLLTGVKRLTVQNWWFEFLTTKDVSSERFVLNNLNYLELQTGYSESDLLGIEALLELSPNLVTMILDFVYVMDEDESLPEEFLSRPISLNLPSLRQVKMKNFRGTDNEFYLLLLLKNQRVVLEKVVVVSEEVGESEISIAALVLEWTVSNN